MMIRAVRAAVVMAFCKVSVYSNGWVCARTFRAVQSDHSMKMNDPASLILGNLCVFDTQNLR
jgi:hypothetical protein